jgi:hypothetical protein
MTMTTTFTDSIKELTQVERFFFLLLYTPIDDRPEPIRGDTWLQKEMFAISKNEPIVEEETDYDAYRYGSFSDTVDEIEDQYRISKYVEKTPDGRIHLTQRGEKLASSVWQTTNTHTRKLVQDIKKEYNDMSQNELLLFMYVTYPETAENSDVKDRILRDRCPLAISLLKKGKVSVQKAAELAGMGLDDFITKSKMSTKQ